jgi:hypothetical protein
MTEGSGERADPKPTESVTEDDSLEIARLVEEVTRLRTENAGLRRKNEELSKNLINRDYEIPPHHR